MKRRSFLQQSTAGLIGLGMAQPLAAKSFLPKSTLPAFVTQDENRVSLFSSLVREPIKVFLAADTHLWMNDERGDPYRKYSDRMAKAYNQTVHFKTGEATHPEKSFEETIRLAVESKADLLALPGDIFSWPSEAAIEWAYKLLESAGIPYIYVAGNHDWHYEGMEGNLEMLRNTWIEKRLLPLYQGQDPLMAAYDIKGVRFLAIDNSTYEVSEAQLAFFREQIQTGMPVVLLVHIPFYAPGRSVGFGCGHPDWGAATDRNHEIERRPKWPESGHTEATMDFYYEVFNASNLLAVFAGHIHRPSFEQINGTPQFVADDNASGGFLDISLVPMAKRDADLLMRK
jgi:predicted phosphodiesterase